LIEGGVEVDSTLAQGIDREVESVCGVNVSDSFVGTVGTD
jgi:hypothetical protein